VADEALVAVPADRVEATAALLPCCRVMAGGATRQDSIVVLAAQARSEWLLVHEGARPIDSLALFEYVIATAHLHGCAGALQHQDHQRRGLADGAAPRPPARMSPARPPPSCRGILNDPELA
jgi:2-C-methyl-D-erythritol 4-phosphate cytidylyltransferase